MAQFLFAKQLTASLSALARLGVADHMGKEAVSAETLAAKVGAHAPSLYRVMRMLAGFDVFREEPGGGFALTPLGTLLRTDAPGSMRYMAMMLGDETSLSAYVHMADCIRTGKDAITLAYGKSIFDLFAERPEQAETFQRAMSGGSAPLEVHDLTVEKHAGYGGGGQLESNYVMTINQPQTDQSHVTLKAACAVADTKFVDMAHHRFDAAPFTYESGESVARAATSITLRPSATGTSAPKPPSAFCTSSVASRPSVWLRTTSFSRFAKSTFSITCIRSPGLRTGVKRPPVMRAISTAATGPSRASGPIAKEWITTSVRRAWFAARSTERTLCATAPPS